MYCRHKALHVRQNAFPHLNCILLTISKLQDRYTNQHHQSSPYCIRLIQQQMCALLSVLAYMLAAFYNGQSAGAEKS